jgi:glycine oxidase
MNTIAILGGGLVGSLLAWRLARQGKKVHLYEAAAENTPQSAAYTAAAMIAPFAERSVCHPEVFNAGLRSLELWPELLKELEQDCGVKVRYQTQGSLLLAHPSDYAEMRQFEADMRIHQLLNHVSVQHLAGSEVRAVEPDVAAHFTEGYWLKNDAQIDNRSLLVALKKAAQSMGVEYYFNSQVNKDHINKGQVNKDGGDWFCDGTKINAEQFIDTRGVNAKSEINNLRGVRGEVLWVSCPEVNIQRPLRLLHPRYHLYLVPRGEGRYQLGATEIESEDRSPVSVRSAMEMLSALWTLVPSMSEARILSFETNLRPATPDHKPIIQQHENTLSINGLFRHGYLLAPALLERCEKEYSLNLNMSLFANALETDYA